MIRKFLFQYLHDGSETTKDEFTVVGKVEEKESVPATVKIKIIGVNDQKPYLVNNNGLELWEGASAIINSNNLGTFLFNQYPLKIAFVKVK